MSDKFFRMNWQTGGFTIRPAAKPRTVTNETNTVAGAATAPAASEKAPSSKRDLRASYLDTVKRFPKTIARLGE